MNLAGMQDLFWSILQGEDRPVDAFTGTISLPASERVAIYKRMVLHRQIDALRETFPKVAAALGDEAFFESAAAYVRAHPSEHPDLAQLGRMFAGVVERADLRELAQLEWARAEVFEAAPAELLSPEEFAALAEDAEAFVHARLQLVPALRLLALGSDVSGLWDETAKVGIARPTALVVWRRGFDVFHVAIDGTEAEAIRLVQDGAPLGEACGAFADPERAAEALQGWLAEGWLARRPCGRVPGSNEAPPRSTCPHSPFPGART